MLEWINLCDSNKTVGRRYYYCYPHVTDDEIEVNEFFEAHGFEPRQAPGPAHLASVVFLARPSISGFSMGPGLPHHMVLGFPGFVPRQRAREKLYHLF